MWRAVHVPTGRPAAVKVLSPEHAGQGRLRAAFRNEVRAAAALDHPHVIALYDHGTVSAEAADASAGALVDGAPWLAMELAEEGDLARLSGRLDAPEVLAVLRALLDALAHAHARRVLHRDLKPSNLVLGGLRPGIKLTDFGLADLDSEGRPGGGGTPAYMPPEQLSHRWRTFGPWTDLFAVGCVGWTLLTGEPPFGHELADVVRRQGQGVPELEREGLEPLEGWLRRLLHADPRRRFATAAEAGRALAGLSPELALDGDLLDGPTFDVPTVQALPTLDWFVTEDTEEAPAAEVLSQGPAPLAPKGVAVPLDWRTPGMRVSRSLLPGAGLSLLRLRPPPLVGREAERDRLWEALRAAVRRRVPQCVVLSGGAGAGKSRLAEWAGQRAHELAAATSLRTTHSPTGGASHGLPALLRRHLRADGLQGPALRAHVGARLGTRDGDRVGSVAALLEPEGQHGVKLGGAEERARVVLDVLETWSSGAPMVVWLDDAHWSPESLDWARRALSSGTGQRLLIVVTVRDDLLPEVAGAAAALQALEEAGVQRLDIGPLAHAAQLTRDALGLEGGLAAEIAERTRGMPLFAVQLVQDWLDRGLLEAGDRGFQLATDHTLSLPPTLDGVWLDRVDRLLAGCGPDDGEALERAAFLGISVDPDEWAAACEDLAADLPMLREALLDQGLAVPLDDQRGFTWVHGLLRESLLARAGEAGRAGAHNAACARAVQRGVRPDNAGRLGRHLLAAGQPERAIEPLLEGVARGLKIGEFGQAAALLGGWEQAMTLAQVPPEDRRWAIGLLRRAEGGTFFDEGSDQLVERALAAARLGGHRLEEALCLRLRAVLWLDQGRLDEGLVDLDAAEALVPDVPAVRIKLATVRATLLRTRGDFVGAETTVEAALALLPQTDGTETGNLYIQIGLLADTRGRYDDGDAAFEQALASYRARGVRRGIAQSLNGQAEVARHRGEIERAAGLYGEALRVYEAIGGAEALYVRANFALIELERRAYGTAVAVLGPAVAEAEASGQGWLLGIIHALFAAASAGTGAWNSARTHLDKATERLTTTGVVDPDLPVVFDLGAALATDAGREELAVRFRAMAKAQRAGLSAS